MLRILTVFKSSSFPAIAPSSQNEIQQLEFNYTFLLSLTEAKFVYKKDIWNFSISNVW